MKKEFSAYELGRTAFTTGKLNITNDLVFMSMLEGLTREEKKALMDEWKAGRREAKAEAEAPVEAPKKKKKKKKVSKKKSKK